MEKMFRKNIKLARTGNWDEVDKSLSEIKSHLWTDKPEDDPCTIAIANQARKLLKSSEGCLRDLGASYVSVLPKVNPNHFKPSLLPSSDIPRGVHDEDYCARFRASCAVVDHFDAFREIASKEHLMAMQDAFRQMKQKEPDLAKLVVSYEHRFEKMRK
jgi:hypothetical protein